MAFPAISCGAYRYPIDQASRVAVRSVHGYLDAALPPTEVILCALDSRLVRALTSALTELDRELT